MILIYCSKNRTTEVYVDAWTVDNNANVEVRLLHVVFYNMLQWFMFELHT
jgi:hypothetical protein